MSTDKKEFDDYESLSQTKLERPGCFLSSPTFNLVVGPAAKTYYVNKALLGSLSRELYTHVYNNMKEGKENSMVLDDEQEETIESFLQWAYVGDYGKLASDASHYLMLHVRLYVFGDRFNIPQLQELALEKFKTTVKTAGYKGLADDGVPSALLVNIIEATLVAFNNLPFPLEGDMLLNFLACHAGWALYSWRKYEGFWELMKNEDFAKALVEKLTETDNPPWYNL